MDEFGKLLFKRIVGKSYDDWVRVPTPDEAVQSFLRVTASPFPARRLGWASDGEVLLLEEERNHTHIIGLPGEGKSKFLEMLIRGDIDNLRSGRSQAGLCLLDSSDFGNTYYKILRYCAKVGYEKVCLIDPNDFLAPDFRRVPTINPIHYKAPTPVVVGSVLEMMRILWDGDDFSQTAKIQEYLQAIVTLLHETGFTLHDAKYFFSRGNEFYNHRREHIFSEVKNPRFNDAYITLEDIFKSNAYAFNNDFGSTIRRLRPIFVKPLELMIGSKEGINFSKLIAEGWVILCNLDPQIWDVPQQRFLGTLIISEILHGAYRLMQAGRNVPFYMYIDEVGRYATRTLADVMNYKRTSRVQLIMAHQDFSQIKHTEVLAAIRNCRLKVMFYVERDDRDKMIKQMYGGDLPPTEVSYILSGLQKQEAVIKINKMPPRTTKLRSIPDTEIPDDYLTEFKIRLYQQPWYRTKEEIYQEINDRFPKVRTEQPGAPDAPRPQRSSTQTLDRKPVVNRAPVVKAQPEREKRPRVKTIFTQAKTPGGVPRKLSKDHQAPKPDGKRRGDKEG